MGHKPKNTPVDKYDALTLSKICSNCHCAALEHHHQYPQKYLKCPQCGYTREIENPKIDSIINTGDFYKHGEGKD